MKKKFEIAVGRGEYSRLALDRVNTEVNRKMEDGYYPSGTMISMTEKTPTDAYTQTIFIQPMVLIKELVIIE